MTAQGDSRDVFRKLGSFTWLAIATLMMEVLNIIKLGHGEFTAPFPRRIVIAWSVAGALFVTVLAAWQVAIWVRAYRAKASPTIAAKKAT